MADLKITQLTVGTPKDTDLYVAVDVTDTTMAPSGTDKQYTLSSIKTDIGADFFTVAVGQLLIGAGAGNPPTGDADLTFTGGNTLNSTIFKGSSFVLNGSTSGTVTLQAGGTVTNYALTFPLAAPVGNGYVMSFTSAGVATFVPVGGSGDVVGPASATDNALARFDTTTGKLIQNSLGILSDAGELTGLTNLTVDNINVDGDTISSTNTNGNIVLDPNGTGIVSAPATVQTSVGFAMVETGGGTDTITHVAPTAVTSSYTVIEPGTIPTTGQTPYVVGVVGSNVTMGWQTGSIPINSTVTTNWVGPWSSPQSGNIRATVDGNTVTLLIPLIQTVASIGGTDIRNTGSELPVGLRPAMAQNIAISSLSDNTNAALLGNAAILTDGTIIISLAQAGINHVQAAGFFTGSGATGWVAFPLCYSLAA